jgi:hypothetical protein
MENIWCRKLKKKQMMALAYCSTSYLFYGLYYRNWRKKKLREAFSFLARRKLKKKQLMTLAYCSTSYLFYGLQYRNWREKKLYERLSLIGQMWNTATLAACRRSLSA